MAGEVQLKVPTPPSDIKEFNQVWIDWLAAMQQRVASGPFLISGYTVATLPPASSWSDGSAFTSLVFVSDETGGATLAFSDGTNWRRVQDRVVVS